MSLPSVDGLPERSIVAARIVVALWLVGWTSKCVLFLEYFFKTLVSHPMVNDFFPVFFRSALVAQVAYLLPLLALCVFVTRRRALFCGAAVVMTLSSALLLLHQDSANDATFETSFWVGAWLVWFSFSMRRCDAEFFLHARSLALCVVAIQFCGGFVGKLTSEYWSGQVLADMFMEQKQGLAASWVRAHFDEATIRIWFQWISKCLIVGEGALALAPLLPYRLVCYTGIPFMLSFALFKSWMIYSVLSCLVGLLIAGWVLIAQEVADTDSASLRRKYPT